MSKIRSILAKWWLVIVLAIAFLRISFLIFQYWPVFAPIPGTNTWPDSHHTLVFYGNIATSPLTTKMALYFFDLDDKRLTYWKPIVASPHDYSLISWAPQAQQLLFDGTIDSVFGLYLMDKDGNIEKLEAFDLQPSDEFTLSPNGSYIVFVYYEDEELYIQDVKGTLPQRLTNNSYIDREPAWSPDGQELIFRSSRLDEGYSAIVRMNRDGTSQREFIQSSNTLLSDPIWSPDGNLLAFKESDEQDGYSIWIMNVDGSNARTVLETNADRIYDIVWSPDSQHIVFVWSKDGNCEAFQVEYQPICSRSFYLVDVHTSEVTRLMDRWILYSNLALAN